MLRYASGAWNYVQATTPTLELEVFTWTSPRPSWSNARSRAPTSPSTLPRYARPLFVRAVGPLGAPRLRLVNLGQLLFQRVGFPVGLGGRGILEEPVADVVGIRPDARFLEDGFGLALVDERLDELLDFSANGLVTRSTLRVQSGRLLVVRLVLDVVLDGLGIHDRPV
jgi:hypothetical protein